jgi:hypothetical protein
MILDETAWRAFHERFTLVTRFIDEELGFVVDVAPHRAETSRGI